MIHIVLGTKAQYIKTAPVLWRLEETGTPYRLIDTGQHAGLTPGVRIELKVREPDLVLRTGGDLARLRSGLPWAFRGFLRAFRDPGFVRDTLFAGQDGICLVHGDTSSTWLGAWWARRAGLAVAHLEAGLRSFHPLSPFPEELCRWSTSHMADLLFPPSSDAAQNLKRMRVSGTVVPLEANTGLESAQFSLTQASPVEPPWPIFALGLIHRMETLYSRRKLRFVVQALRRASQVCPVLLLLHEPTRRALARDGWLSDLSRQERIRRMPLVSHGAFLRLLSRARFVMTDGGSVQEESFYLNVPCLLLRDRTERIEGFQPPGNVRLAQWRWERVEAFLKEPERFRHRQPQPQGGSSSRVVEELVRFDRS